MAKKPSGAQNRKAVKQRKEDNRQRQIETGKSWLSQPGYEQAAEQYDPNGPAWQLPVYGQAYPLTMRGIQVALQAYEQGQWWQPSVLFDFMLRDDRVSSKSEERVDRLVGAEWEYEPANDSQAALDCMEATKKYMPEMLPAAQQTSFQRNALGLSVGVAQVKSIRMGLGMRLPTIWTWNNRNMWYDWLLRKLRMTTQNRETIVLEADDPEWAVFEPYGEWGWLTGGKVRSIALPWLIRTWTRNYWARWGETNGIPMRAGIIPMQRDPADEKIFLAQLANIGAEAVMRLPQGEDGNKFDVKLIESAGKGWEGFERLLLHCDDAIAISWLGQVQSTKGQGGLGTQENAGESTMLRITRKDARVDDIYRIKVLEPFAADNFGSADLAPKVTRQIEPPADEAKAADVDLKISQAVGYFKTAGAPIDTREYLSARGYPLLTEEQHAAQKAAAVEEARANMEATTPADPNADKVPPKGAPQDDAK